ncbi:MAG: virulence factor, partial [Bacteroidetes bacterium]|nr:virulence factor [Bacteroidota bacterium]
DAQKYFWNSKTPARAAADIGGVIERYMQLWKVNKFIIAGYSFGADVLPFIISDLPAELSQKIEHSYMISPSENADFEIHISDMLNFGSSSDTYDVIAQLKKMANLKPVCIFGDEEEESTKLNFIRAGAEIVVLPGSHHYNNDFEKLSNVLYKK